MNSSSFFPEFSFLNSPSKQAEGPGGLLTEAPQMLLGGQKCHGHRDCSAMGRGSGVGTFCSEVFS